MATKFERILFGSSGDLAQRKLLPALYFLQLDDHLDDTLNHIYAAGRQHGTGISRRQRLQREAGRWHATQ